ncbi:hypothetical protein [Bacillus cereus]|uniref:hypothetical protein n=1 Tax=Bacillus cereus TaxID=1396 RepID=UPI000BEC613C|nr:hypothetical protein [Bacillus cereus]PED33904.1 hypothetical protein CON13_01655 [Bacillus cereus]PEE52075.1 hypothetical protein COM80_16655 [Bacillus cereus]PFL90921.1 hypothetical protein COJ35_24330 [Bacillus cereus]PFV69448.1 hypothetical protein COL16_18395 [Bacillus cereus]PGS34974.1 hypothetical protein COC56_16680 [Bacillus cereus]
MQIEIKQEAKDVVQVGDIVEIQFYGGQSNFYLVAEINTPYLMNLKGRSARYVNDAKTLDDIIRLLDADKKSQDFALYSIYSKEEYILKVESNEN